MSEFVRPNPRTNASVNSMLSALISGTNCFRSQATDGLPITWNIKHRRFSRTNKIPLQRRQSLTSAWRWVSTLFTIYQLPCQFMHRITDVKCDTLTLNVNKLSMNTWPGEHKPQSDWEKAHATGDGYLGIGADTAVRCRGYDLRCRGSQVAVAHNTRLGHPKAKDQVVSPQRYIVISAARSAGLLCIHRIADEKKNALMC